MSNYTVSQKIAIINDIDQESRELWMMLNETGVADLYTQDQIKDLFVNMLSKDKDGHTRFNVQVSDAYIEDAVSQNNEDLGVGTAGSNFDLLSVCHSVTRKQQLHSFLFNLGE